MRHEREFRIERPCDVPHPNWEMAIFWGLAALFGVLFWLGVIRMVFSF